MRYKKCKISYLIKIIIKNRMCYETNDCLYRCINGICL